MPKYFSKAAVDNHEHSFCYDIEWVRDDMRIDGVTSREFYVAEPDIKGEGFWCQQYEEAGMRGEGSCGALCKGYAPMNGMSGRCKHWDYTYSAGDLVTIKL